MKDEGSETKEAGSGIGDQEADSERPNTQILSPIPHPLSFIFHSSDPSARRVLIVGGSTRAAAWSAVRAGWKPICADLFADRDTRQIADIIPVRDFPSSLPEDVAKVQADGWFYTGGLENHPEIVERMMRPDAPYGPLRGTPPAALRLVRDPFWLAETLREAGLPALEVLPESWPPPADGTWLQKPLASAGGRAIRVWDHAAASRDFGEPHYFQFFQEASESRSAIFFADGCEVEWQGATLALIGQECSRAPHPFSYCGSTGPTVVPDQVRQILQQMAEAIVHASGVVGLFGIDFQIQGQTPWLVELNPRYTAAVEILELMSRRSLLRLASAANSSPPPLVENGQWSRWVSKIVLYASHSFVAPDWGRLLGNSDPWQVPNVADVPVEGALIEAGWPICSVFDTHDHTDRTACQNEDGLLRRVHALYQSFVDPAAAPFQSSSLPK